MTKRLISIIITAVMLLTAALTGFSAELPDYIPDEYFVIADEIADAARNFKPSVNFGGDGISVDALQTIMILVLNENPDLFHLSSSYRYTMPYDNPDVALGVMLIYKMYPDDYAAAMEKVNRWVDGVVSLADPSFTDYEYALFFHDYLATGYDYDLNYGVRDVYEFIKHGIGVCQAYTYAYMMLLERVGIECSFASSSEMNHIWNVVKIDGEWYHVDVTWDDPTGAIPGKAKHDYFLLSDTGMLNAKTPHYGWVSLYECTSEKYADTAVNQAKSSYAYLDGKWYYLADSALYVTDSPATEGTKVRDLDGMIWNVWESTSYYTSIYSGILAYDGKLYVNSAESLLEIHPSTLAVYRVMSYTGGNGYVYGFMPYMGDDGVSGADLDTGKVILNIAKKPGESEDRIIVELKLGGESAVPGSGDSNGDGSVNLSDVTKLLQYIAKWTVRIDTAASDSNSDGSINLLDVSHVMKVIAGWNM